MCLSDVGRVVEVDAGRHAVSVDLGERIVSVSTVTLGLDVATPAVGDWLVVHTGFAIGRLTEAAATDILRARNELASSATDRQERP